MKRAVFLLLLLTVESVSFSQNLAVNPGVETWSKINRPAEWTHVESCLKDSSVVHSGNYSCMHSGGATTTSDLGQTIQVYSGKEYKLSLYYKTGTSSTGKGSRIWCYWKNVEGNNINDASTDDIMRPSQYLKSDNWQQFSITVIAPPEAVAFYLEVRTNSNSVTYWDDFVFEEIVPTCLPEDNHQDIKLFPNPAHSYLIIKNIQNLQCISIQSLTGATIWSSKFSNEQSAMVPLTGLVNGVYIIHIHTSEKLFIRKFIKRSN